MRLNLVNMPSRPVFKVGALVFCAAVAALALAPGRVLRTVSGIVAGLLAGAFILLVVAEQIQDRVLFRTWAREKQAGMGRSRAGRRECPACGFRGNREYDRSCRSCAASLVSSAGQRPS